MTDSMRSTFSLGTSSVNFLTYSVAGVNRTFVEWEHHKHEDIMGFRNNHHKHEDIMGFRNNAYRSLMTGNMQAVHHTPWLEALDDSMDSYLKSI